MRKHVAFVCALLVMHPSLFGCATYKPVPKAGPEFEELSVGTRPTLRLTLHSGDQLDLHEVTVNGDSLYGYLERPPRVPPQSPTYGGVKLQSVAKADVQSIQVRKRSYTGLVVGAVLVGFGAYLISSGGWGPKFEPSEPRPSSPTAP